MAYKMVLLDIQDAVATITLNRPEKRNAFNMAMMGEIDMAFEEAARDKRVRAVVLTGAGTAFSSGLDFNWIATMEAQDLPPMASTVRGRMVTHAERSFLTTVLKLRSMPKPVIAAVNGVAMGGALVLVLACDLKVASDSARFSMPQTKRALIPDGGGTYLLPRAVGLSKALELALIGEPVDAREAQRIGIVNRVVPHDDLMATALDMARKIAANAPLAVAMTKEAMYRSVHGDDLAAHMDYEVYVMNILFSTEDFKEGLASLWEKRDAVFTGR